jgi:Signal transduction histidine kinase
MATRTARVDEIPFRIHPRVFAALGADLVTNDVVAVIELVKNAYDAFASRVDVRFGTYKSGKRFLDILDDGSGMDRRTLEDAWCVVATPYRQQHPTTKRGQRVRRVAGEKGLGRLSAARLGKKLEMLTKAAGEPCWQVDVDWTSLSLKESLDTCSAKLQRFKGESPFGPTGTRVRVQDLTSEWDSEQIADLQENLARLVSPFRKINDFAIHISAADSGVDALSAEITSPRFLNSPPYAIRGEVTKGGVVRGQYEHRPIGRGRRRTAPVTLTWSDVREGSEIGRKLAEIGPACGPFSFELRAWDIGTDDTQEISNRFEIAKGNVRKAIRAHKGISVYRDGILVLPKSEDSRDWLGLDLRRVSRVGTRLSTSQIVGYVSITALSNGAIEDTSDREGLVSSPPVQAFQEILKSLVSKLELERDIDRMKPGDEVQLKALLDGISGSELLDQVNELADDGEASPEAVRRVEAFNAKLESAREALKKRFVFYSRLATVGTIAQMLVHEIRNRTTSVARFLRTSRDKYATAAGAEFEKQLSLAESSVSALERLADTFAPLASRSFRRGRRDAILEQSIARCLSLVETDLRSIKADVHPLPATATPAAIDPGELDTVILNLLLNAVYWIPKSSRPPRLDVTLRKVSDGKRARVSVSDSGPGVSEEDADRIFLPGVTRRPGGIGMGLTVASEIVSEHGGQLSLVQPGKLGGATFTFDVPVKS